MKSCFNCVHCTAPNGMLLCTVTLPAIVLMKTKDIQAEYENFNPIEIYQKSPEEVAEKCLCYKPR